jgi:hypothetical protein
MTSRSRRALVRVLITSAALSLVLTPGLVGTHSPGSFNGSVVSADASTPRSYVEFIEGAYVGALGRLPTCEEEQAEYDALDYATSTGNRLAEARRFASTLFETQASFNDPDSNGLYCQTAEYEARNPAGCAAFVNNRSGEFITDLYAGFLLRQPEQAGFDYWMNAIPTYGRKEVLRGFRDSTEFGILVGALYAGERPSCGCGFFSCEPGFTPMGETCTCVPDCEGPNNDGHYSRLCP